MYRQRQGIILLVVITAAILKVLGFIMIMSCDSKESKTNQFPGSITSSTMLVSKITTTTTIKTVSTMETSKRRQGVLTPQKKKNNRKFKSKKKNVTSTTSYTIEAWKKSVVALEHDIELLEWMIKVQDKNATDDIIELEEERVKVTKELDDLLNKVEFEKLGGNSR